MEYAASERSGWHASLRMLGGTRQKLPGIALCGAISAASLALGELAWCRAQGLSPLVIGMLCGAAAGNLFRTLTDSRMQPGTAFCKLRLLRIGIILFGVRLTLGDIALVGLPGVAADALVLGSTFLLALVVGTGFSRWTMSPPR